VASDDVKSRDVIAAQGICVGDAVADRVVVVVAVAVVVVEKAGVGVDDLLRAVLAMLPPVLRSNCDLRVFSTTTVAVVVDFFFFFFFFLLFFEVISSSFTIFLSSLTSLLL